MQSTVRPRLFQSQGGVTPGGNFLHIGCRRSYLIDPEAAHQRIAFPRDKNVFVVGGRKKGATMAPSPVAHISKIFGVDTERWRTGRRRRRNKRRFFRSFRRRGRR